MPRASSGCSSFPNSPRPPHPSLRRWHGRTLIDELARQGILIRTRSLRGAAEEAPGAYKDIERVAETTERAGLARRVVRLRPLACLKG